MRSFQGPGASACRDRPRPVGRSLGDGDIFGTRGRRYPSLSQQGRGVIAEASERRAQHFAALAEGDLSDPRHDGFGHIKHGVARRDGDDAGPHLGRRRGEFRRGSSGDGI